MMSKTIFITGTDTGVGKTSIAVALLQALQADHLKTLGLKPISAGCELDATGQWVNADTLALQAASTVQCAYQEINPIVLPEPIAPHIAAQRVCVSLSMTDVTQKVLNTIKTTKADMNVIEGAGGWAVPLNAHESMADLVCALHVPVILVVGMRLGCLNHAILTAQSIANAKVPFVGWIANSIDPDMLVLQDNIATLKQWIPAPCLGVVPYGDISHQSVIDIARRIKALCYKESAVL